MEGVFSVELLVKLSDGAKMPSHSHVGDAGLDLALMESVNIMPCSSVTVSTGVSVAIPEGYVGIVAPRSSMGRRGITIANSIGVIDSGYRGEIHLELLNTSMDTVKLVCEGERVAQLVVMPYAYCECVRTDSLDETERGTDGLGSTGRY